jgi:glycosyltransferase involved in cell wall biosynthesis
MPFITVAIPTYRRLPLLRRAVECVFAQTFTDWELVVSDDEMPSGEAWNFLNEVASADPRVRPIKNAAPHGAPFNHNTALKAACGEWIKILEDDDVLKPNCLDVLANIVKERRDVVAVSCACETFVDGKLVAPFYRRDRGLLEEIGPNDALLAMYILDEACWARPTQQMVHRSVVDAGVLFQKAPGISHLYDAWFNARVRACGPSLIYNAPLAEWHQGKHESLTSAITQDQLLKEFVAFRRLILPLVPMNKNPPDLRCVERMVIVVQSFVHLRSMRLGAAAKLAIGVWDARAYNMAIRWLLRQFYPRRFSSIDRKVVWQ